MKHQIDAQAAGQPGGRKHTVTYSNPHQNPFKTYPKDGAGRSKDDRTPRTASGGSYGTSGPLHHHNSYNNIGGGYRGGRGGGYNRGMSHNMGGYNNSRNFSNPMATATGAGGSGGYNPAMPSGGFPNNMAGMNQFSGFNNRGGSGGNMMNQRGNGMGGMRGGRGGNNMTNGMAMMGGVGGIGAMGMGMGMNPMMPNMGMAAAGATGSFPVGNTSQFNPAFFAQGQAAVGGGSGGSGGTGAVGMESSWNPHGAKRTRQE